MTSRSMVFIHAILLFVLVLSSPWPGLLSLRSSDNPDGRQFHDRRNRQWLWAAPKKKVKVRRKSCVRYRQTLGSDEQSVDIRLHNRCMVVMSCRIRWKLSCDEDSDPPRDFDDEILLNRKESKTISASATACGDDGWSIDAIHWKCAESNESK